MDQQDVEVAPEIRRQALLDQLLLDRRAGIGLGTVQAGLQDQEPAAVAGEVGQVDREVGVAIVRQRPGLAEPLFFRERPARKRARDAS